ncbi:MAG: CDP-alcohol phosphatidyltransferase family protein, partial [Oscillospiraceae bacterium]|nr:CDP-alcohol phosphatidyltransferase family protein [Oscillospiraceae bacterium]
MEKKKSKLRHIPNILSLSRIPFSIAMPFLVAKGGKYSVAFLVCYGVAGVTDALDGALARRFHWESRLGQKIDSIGDGVFIVCVIIAVILSLGPSLRGGNGIEAYCYAILGVLLAIKLVNIAFTRIKFKQWGFIHLRSARWSIIPLYVLFPVCIHQQKVYNPFVAVCLVLSILACVEEICILVQMDKHEYTM